MTYYIYENVVRRSARVHHADCGHCQSGQGKLRVGPRSQTGRWHGPFKTLSNARRRLQAIPARTKVECTFCLDP
jgi:hypothetical protein